jgi:hypothetical protein
MYENSVPRKMFGPKREEVTESWRRLHNEELHNLYPLPNITMIKLKRYVSQGMWQAWER